MLNHQYNRVLEALINPIEKLDVVQWCEKNRYLGSEITSQPGKMDYGVTPYLIKFANSIMPENKAEIIAMMKGSQVGISIGGIYSQMGWAIANAPANMLFITETDDKVKEQMQKPISQMLDNSNLTHLLGSVNSKPRYAKGRRNKSTGDTKEGLEFRDGFLYTWSGQKIGGLSTYSAKYGFYDEVERWKGNYKDAGSFLKLVEPRHKAYGSQRKLIFLSTPEVKQTSNIEPLYEKGDQQKYHIPCPKCNQMIDLVWSVDVNGEKAGIVYKRDGSGRYKKDSAGYVCQKCGHFFKEDHKFEMYEQTIDAFRNERELICDWIPTAEPESEIYESYHISSLYAPLGFYSWNHIAREWCEMHPINAPVKYAELQTFYNQTLGLTWEIRSVDIKANVLSMNTRNYPILSVPNELSKQHGNGRIIMITCAIDLNGELNDEDEMNDDVRLDYEIVAWCQNGDDDYVSSYSIDHGSIGTFQRTRDRKKGESESSRVKCTYRHGRKNNAFDIFESEVMTRVYLDENGKEFKVFKYGVDTGHFTVHANEFVAKHARCIALKGASDEGFTKNDANKAYYRKGKQPNLYIVEGDLVKDKMADMIELKWNERVGQEQPMGIMNYPLPEGLKYSQKGFFVEYEGEKREVQMNATGSPVGFRWTKKNSHSRNHFWDCRIYNYVTMQVSKELVCKEVGVPVGWDNLCKLLTA